MSRTVRSKEIFIRERCGVDNSLHINLHLPIKGHAAFHFYCLAGRRSHNGRYGLSILNFTSKVQSSNYPSNLSTRNSLRKGKFQSFSRRACPQFGVRCMPSLVLNLTGQVFFLLPMALLPTSSLFPPYTSNIQPLV